MDISDLEALTREKTRARSVLLEAGRKHTDAQRSYADAHIELTIAKRLVAQGAHRPEGAPTLTHLAQDKTRANSLLNSTSRKMADAERAYTHAHTEWAIARRLRQDERLGEATPDEGN